MRLDKIMYGLKVAAYWWNKQMNRDQCVMVKSEGHKISYCAITVGDCFFAITRDEDWIKESIEMLKGAFEELTIERGDSINILEMTVHMERDKGRALINEKRYLDKLISTSYGITKTAITPA